MSCRVFIQSVFAILLVSALGTARAADDFDLAPSPGFVKLPDGWELGACSAVAVNSRGEILLFHRGKRPLIVLDDSGKVLRSWGDDLIKGAHGLRVDREDNVWVTDIGAHRVHKFDPAGKLLLSLGDGKPGTGDDQFNKPTDIGFGAAGEFFVTDGYGNARVLKYSPLGKRLLTWGTPGKAPGEFNLPHAVVLDARGRVLVGDRENDRIQIFDQTGKLLEVWPGFAPYGLALDLMGVLFVADARAHKVHRLDATGKIVRTWGGQGKEPGQFDLPHMLAFDAAGNLYVAEVAGMRLQKFTRK